MASNPGMQEPQQPPKLKQDAAMATSISQSLAERRRWIQWKAMGAGQGLITAPITIVTRQALYPVHSQSFIRHRLPSHSPDTLKVRIVLEVRGFECGVLGPERPGLSFRISKTS